MRMERINESQIRCVLSESDLAKRQLSINKLKYGSAEAAALFRELIDEAVNSYSFNEANYPVMVEAIPVGQGELMFILSAIDEIEEMDPHFAKFAQTDSIAPVSGSDAGSSFTVSEEDCPEECVFLLNSIEELFPLAKHFGKTFPGETLLYNGPRPHTYYLLVMSLGKIDRIGFLRYLNAMEEFASLCYDEPLLAAHLTEHEIPVMISPLKSLSSRFTG